MKIALVDDDPRALAQLEQYLTEQLGRETEISHYGSGEALLADWRPGAFELVVLDIYMGGATGMEVARRLRAGDGQVRLAFATSSNDFASESYEVGACYYLRKPFRPEGVRAMLERLDLEALERSRRLRLPDGSQVVLRSIRYAASDGHRVTLHCKDGDRTLRTSFAAVEVIPDIENDSQDVEIKPDDYEMQVYRSSGAGGQHINKTSSAVRLIHKPTGMIAECQEERSQFQNREKAMRLLASRLYEAEREKRESAYDAERRSQVGSGDRSQRIRTYNFPQGRVTDHRIGLTLYKIDAIMDGALDELIDALVTADQAEKLKQGQEAE